MTLTNLSSVFFYLQVLRGVWIFILNKNFNISRVESNYSWQIFPYECLIWQRTLSLRVSIILLQLFCLCPTWLAESYYSSLWGYELDVEAISSSIYNTQLTNVLLLDQYVRTSLSCLLAWYYNLKKTYLYM